MRGHNLRSILSSRGVSTTLLKVEICLFFAGDTSAANTFRIGYEEVVYGLPQDIRKPSLRTVTRKPAYHQCPSTPQQINT